MSSKVNFTLSDEYLELLSDLKCEVLNDTVSKIAEAYYGFESAKRSIFEVRLMQAMCFVGLSSANIAKFLPDCEEANEYAKVLADIPASSEKRRSRVSSANFRAHASIFVYIFAYLAAAIREDRMTYDDLDNLCPNCLLVLKKNDVCPCCKNDAGNATFKEDHGEVIVRFLLRNIGDYYIERAYSAMRDLLMLKTSGKFVYILSPIAPFVDDLKYVLTTAGMRNRIAKYDFVTIDGCVLDTSANAVEAKPVISKVKSKSKPKPKPKRKASSSTSKPKAKPKRKASSTTTTSSSKPKAKKQKRKAPSSSLNTPMTAPLSELPMIMQKPPPPSSNLIGEWSDEGPSFLSEKKVHEPVMGALAFPIIETDENLFQWVDEHITTNTTNMTNTNIVNYHDFMNSIRPPSF